MGSCCQFFSRNEIENNQNRLSLLEAKVQAQYHTENDHYFTYYLHYFDHHEYLRRVLQQSREFTDKTEDSSGYQMDVIKIQNYLTQVSQYMFDVDNRQSMLNQRIAKDLRTIAEWGQKYSGSADKGQTCMIKLQIQGFELIQGISRLGIVKIHKGGQKQVKTEEFIMISRTKQENIYRQLLFPEVKNSKIMLVTEPIISAVTIDIEDVMKNEAVCAVFKFQNSNQDFGFVGLRLQFVTNNFQFNFRRRQGMMVLQKELKICMAKKNGVLSSISESDSHKNTFVSDHVSEYHNQYEA